MIKVDHEKSQLFVSNILTAYQIFPEAVEGETDSVKERFHDNLKEISEITLKLVKSNLDLGAKNLKNVVKTCTSLLIIPEIREMVASKLQEWLDNPLVSSFGPPLFSKIIEFTKSSDPLDIQITQHLSRIKTKKLQAQVYQEGMNKLMSNNADYSIEILRESLKTLSQGKLVVQHLMVDSMKQLGINGENILSRFFQEVAYDNDENFLRKLISKIAQLLPITNWINVCLGILIERSEMFNQDKQQVHNWVMRLCDVVCSGVIFSIPPILQETLSVSSSSKQIEKNRENIEWRHKIAKLQQECVVWTKDTAPKYLQSTDPTVYLNIIKKLLFINPIASYFSQKLDIKTEKKMLSLLSKEMPATETTLSTIAYIFDRITFLNKSFCNTDALEIIEVICVRASLSSYRVPSSLNVINPETIENIFKLTVYPTPNGVNDPQSILCVSNW